MSSPVQTGLYTRASSLDACGGNGSPRSDKKTSSVNLLLSLFFRAKRSRTWFTISFSHLPEILPTTTLPQFLRLLPASTLLFFASYVFGQEDPGWHTQYAGLPIGMNTKRLQFAPVDSLVCWAAPVNDVDTHGSYIKTTNGGITDPFCCPRTEWLRRILDKRD
jgi:hypothetical protein